MGVKHNHHPDLKLLEKMAFFGATNVDMAAVIGVHRKTLELPKYRNLIEKARAQGRVSILEWQMREAKAGNPALLIWSGKVRCSQREEPPPQDKSSPRVNVVFVQGGNPEDIKARIITAPYADESQALPEAASQVG